MELQIANKNIVLYGLSTETEKVILEWKDKYNIVGLLDGFKNSGWQFGFPVLDINDVVEMSNVIIIVVARPGSCKAIIKRIRDICKENNVEVFDIRGKDLMAEAKAVYDYKSIVGYQKVDLLKCVEQIDTVSFDLFDTLVVRNVLSFEDVIGLVQVQLEEKDIVIENFVEKRIAAEKKLSQGHAPRLEKIYEEILFGESRCGISAIELAEIEYRLDVKLLQPRKSMVQFLTSIKNEGKYIYITSDSYYSKKQIECILEKMEIKNIDGILVSCEYDTGKTDNLFSYLEQIASTKNILHIGDDFVADIESAKCHGLQAFQIYSTTELLDELGGLQLVDDEMSLPDRIRIGMFAATIFNSPFQFEDEEKRICVGDAYDIGYLFVAPIILDFVKWFGQQVKTHNIANIWFGARDGYLIKKLYEILYPDEISEYFLTSRIAAIRAGINSVTDVEYVDSMKFSGSIQDNLKVRFGIDEKILELYKVDDSKEGLLKYSSAILDIAKIKKDNYLRYIQKLNIKEGEIAFFDFVAKGTSQMYIQKLIQNKIKGLYFLQLEPEFMRDKQLDITSFYTDEEKNESAIFDSYYILETLLTAPYPSLDEFDAIGNPIYTSETRTKENIDCFMMAQNGIISYVEKFLSICPQRNFCFNKKLDEKLLMLMHNVKIKDKAFLSLIVEDPFFNRKTEIEAVL